MTTITKTKVRPRSTAKQRPPMEETPAEMLSRPAWTHEERLQHIQALGQRIESHKIGRASCRERVCVPV